MNIKLKSMDNCWLLNGKCISSQPEGYVGFVYRITLLVDTPLNLKGAIYIGKKIFLYKKRTKLSKKARIGTRKRVKTSTTDSQWLNYFGSSLELKSLVKEIGEDKFKREILHLCKNKAEMSYFEVKEQIDNQVFHVPSFNRWISCKIYKKGFNQ